MKIDRTILAAAGGFLIFFPSRRRHTIYWRDWSSDVCSSDLEQREEFGDPLGGPETRLLRAAAGLQDLVEGLDFPPRRVPADLLDSLAAGAHRQVGQELPLDRPAAARRGPLRPVQPPEGGGGGGALAPDTREGGGGGGPGLSGRYGERRVGERGRV